MWSQVVKYSQGKRLNQNYSTGWEAAVGAAVMAKSNPDDYIPSYMTNQLGTRTTMQQAGFRTRNKRRNENVRQTKKKEKTINARKFRKIVKSHMGRKDTKEYKYQPEKFTKPNHQNR